MMNFNLCFASSLLQFENPSPLKWLHKLTTVCAASSSECNSFSLFFEKQTAFVCTTQLKGQLLLESYPSSSPSE